MFCTHLLRIVAYCALPDVRVAYFRGSRLCADNNTIGQAFSEISQLGYLHGLRSMRRRKRLNLCELEVLEYLKDLRAHAEDNDPHTWCMIANNPFASYILARCHEKKVTYFPVDLPSMYRVIGTIRAITRPSYRQRSARAVRTWYLGSCILIPRSGTIGQTPHGSR